MNKHKCRKVLNEKEAEEISEKLNVYDCDWQCEELNNKLYLTANDEFGVEVNYCPFCGYSVDKEDKK